MPAETAIGHLTSDSAGRHAIRGGGKVKATQGPVTIRLSDIPPEGRTGYPDAGAACDMASPNAFVALHPRAGYGSKAAIWTGHNAVL